MKRCTSCGMANDDLMRFCTACGKVLPNRIIPSPNPAPVMASTVCRTCRSPLNPSVRFCTVCGTPSAPAPQMAAPAPQMVAPACLKCGTPLRPGVKFCTVCGTPAAAPAPAAPVPQPAAAGCAKCGAPLNPGVKFCTVCGTPAAAPAPAAPAPQPAPAAPAQQPAPAAPAPQSAPAAPAPQPAPAAPAPQPAPAAPAPQPAPAAPAPQPAPVAPAPAAPAPQPAPAAPVEEPKKESPVVSESKEEAADEAKPASPVEPPKKKSKGLLIGIIGGGVALVAAVVVVLFLFVFTGPKDPLKGFLKPDVQYQTIQDARDQQNYRVIQVGSQLWMAQNLNYAAAGSFCDSCTLLGRNYSWDAAQNSCPAGFVLPSMTDFENLMSHVNDVTDLMSMPGWAYGAGADRFSLAMLPTGFLSFKDDVIKRRGEMTGFWTRSSDGKFAMRLKVDAKNTIVSLDGLEMEYGFPVRCISRESSVDDGYEFMVDPRTAKPLKTVKIGDQVWIEKNMNYKSSKMTKNYCYDDLESNCETDGRLYEWSDAVASCPEGTRLPNTQDFEKLARYLKTSGDYSAFAPTYAGFRNSKGVFELENIRADYWSSSDVSGMGKYWYFSANKPGLVGNKYSKKGAMLARCIKDTLVIDYSTDVVTDYRDGRSYNTVKIGTQTWMAENAKYVTDDSYCYNNESENCEIYGRLYPWVSAIEACPAGFHMPDDEDWIKLKNYISDRGNGKLVSMLKSADYWKTSGRDVVGMNIRPSGYRGAEDGKYGRLGERAYLWSASIKNWDSAYHWSLVEGSEYFGKATVYKENARAVRCVRNY